MNEELSAAVTHLETYGYCLLPERIPRAEALALGARCLELHADPQYADFIHGDEQYQTLFGMLNLDDRVWQYAFHRDALAIARHAGIPLAERVAAAVWQVAARYLPATTALEIVLIDKPGNVLARASRGEMPG